MLSAHVHYHFLHFLADGSVAIANRVFDPSAEPMVRSEEDGREMLSAL